MSHRSFKSLRTAALLAALVWPLVASAASAETLAEAAALTMQAHPALRASEAQVRAATEAVTIASSNYLPQLALNSELNTDNYNRSVGSVGLTGREVGLSASQMIFDGSATGHRVTGAKAERDAEALDRAGDQNQLLLAVARVYVAVMRDRDLLAAARRNVAYHQDSVKKLQQMVASDPGRAFDLTQVQARVAMAQSTLVERQAALRASEAAYREIVGRVPGALSLPQVPVVPELRSLDQALTVGQAEHPTVKAAGARTKVREAARGEAQGSLVPRLDAMARYVRGMDRQSLPGQNDEVYAGLRATYAFPLGMATVAQARGAEMLLESQTHKLEAARRDVREGLEATLPLATEHWKRVGKVLEGFKTQYSLGRRSMLDLLIVQDEVYSAESRKIQLTYDRVLADFAVMAQAGTLVAHYAPADDTPAPATPPLRIERADGPAAEQVSQH